MRYPELTPDQRMRVANLAGHLKRVSFGNLKHLPPEQKIADLREISTDPIVLGHQLGDCLANIDEIGPSYQACVDLLRAAGADEREAERKLEWRRWNRRRREESEGRPML